MRRSSLVILVAGLCLAGQTGAHAAVDPAYEQELIHRVTAAFGSTRAPLSAEDTLVHGLKCGAPLALEVRLAWPNLSEPTRLELAALMALSRPILDEQYDTPDGRFRFHYSRHGADSINMDYGVGPGDVPRYILTCDSLLQIVVAKEIDTLGFRFPISDQLGRPGEDPRYDIYFIKLSPDYYGLSMPDTVVQFGAGTPILVTSWIELRTDYSDLYGYRNHPFDAMAVTLAHEFNHASQWSYDALESEFRGGALYPWWLEVSAVAMEDVVFDQVNDYFGYLPYWFNSPWISLRAYSGSPSPDGFHPYASAIWALYLVQRFHDPAILREIWDVCAQVPGFNTFDAFKQTIAAHGSSFEDEWAEFLVWNYFTGPRAVGWSYKDASHYPGLARLDSVYYTQYPLADSTSRIAYPHSPDELAATYLRFVPPGSTTSDTFRLLVTPSQFGEWMVVTAGINGTSRPDIQHTRDVTEPIVVPNWNLNDELLVIVSPFKENPKQERLDRNLGFHFEVRDSFPADTQKAAFKIFSNPLILTGAGGEGARFRIKVTRTEQVPVSMHIYTLNGQLIRGGEADNDGRDNTMFFGADRTERFPELSWDGTNHEAAPVASGIYLALIQVGGKSELIKVAVKNRAR